jgi:MFS transporter, DHA1 family, inner membrane transport protein
MSGRATATGVHERGARRAKPQLAHGLAGASRARVGLAVLGLGAFTVGTSELVVVGILDLIARDAGVSVSAAGSLVTAYALGVAVGGPLVTALTARFDRRRILRIALAAYVGGNLLTAVTATFGLLVASRALTGTVHGLFIGVATVVAAGLAKPGREGRAIAMVFGGIAISTVVGVPLGTLIGQTVGWQASFVAIVVLGSIALGLVLATVPPVAPRGSGRVGEEARSALTFPVFAILGIGFLIIGGQFTALTYLAPFLDEVTGISGGAISAVLLAFGIATAAGAFASGRAADRSASRTLIAANVGLTAMLLALYLVGTVPALAVLALVGWGLVGFGLVSTVLQLRVIALAGPGGDLAASLGASAANAGIAIGALVGGQVIANVGVRETALAGALMLLACLPATVAARSLRPAAPGERVTSPPIQADAEIGAVGGSVGR